MRSTAAPAGVHNFIYPSEITALQKDYADLWEPLSELLKKLSAVVSL